jgi:hypothetical protein
MNDFFFIFGICLCYKRKTEIFIIGLPRENKYFKAICYLSEFGILLDRFCLYIAKLKYNMVIVSMIIPIGIYRVR